MLSNELENSQSLVGSRYSTPRFNGTKFQPCDPFTFPQTPKIRSRPISPEIELANVSTSPPFRTSPRPESRDGRLTRSLIRSTTPPYRRVSSPSYKFRNITSPLPTRGTSSLDTPKDLVLRVKSMRYSRSSRSRSPRGRYNLHYDPSLSQISPSFSWPISSVSPINYRYGYRGTRDTLSNGNPSTSPRARFRLRPNLQDLSPSFYSPSPNDKPHSKAELATQGNHETQLTPKFRSAPSFEDSQLFFAPKPVSQLPATLLFNDTSDVESRHTPEMHSIPPTASESIISKNDLDSQTTHTSVSGDHLPILQADEPERFPRLKDYAKFFVTDTLPRQLYLLFLFRLPALYFVRVARIFEESDLTLEEIEEMAVNVINAHDDGHEHLNTNPAYERVKTAWGILIGRFVREWETFNVVSVLLLPAIVTMFQIQGATDDPVTRYIAFWSLICALLSSLYDCLFIICFPTMRKPHKAAAWAFEALKTQKIFWNVWVMLAMPAVWMCWSIVTFIVCIMSFMWRSRAELPSDHQFSVAPFTELVMRIFICVVLGLGVTYGFLIFTTLNRFGSGMDRAWRLRAEAFYAPPMPRTNAPSLPPEYRTTERPVVGATSSPRPAEPGQDYPSSGSPSQDQDSTPNRSSLPPAYPPTPNPTAHSKDVSNRKSVVLAFSPPVATHSGRSRVQKSDPSGRTDIARGLPPRRSISPDHRQTYSGRRSPDVQKASDEDRGRTTVAHSRSRSHLQNQADYAVGTSRGLQDSPDVRIKNRDNGRGRISRDSFFLDFSGNDGEILIEEIREGIELNQARLSS